MGVTGPSSIELIEHLSPDEYRIKMTAEGTYYFTTTVTGPDENTYQDTVAITVMNRDQLDRILKAKWEGMKGALLNQNVSVAVNYFTDEYKDLYTEIYTALYDQLPQLAQGMQNIQLITATGIDAKYRIRREETYGGQPVTITYYIYFGIDQNGIWKIVWY